MKIQHSLLLLFENGKNKPRPRSICQSFFVANLHGPNREKIKYVRVSCCSPYKKAYNLIFFCYIGSVTVFPVTFISRLRVLPLKSSRNLSRRAFEFLRGKTRINQKHSAIFLSLCVLGRSLKSRCLLSCSPRLFPAPPNTISRRKAAILCTDPRHH